MDTRIVVLFLCMVVVLGLLLFQAKARIYIAEAGSGEKLPRGKRLRRYLLAAALWAVITAGVMLFALTR